MEIFFKNIFGISALDWRWLNVQFYEDSNANLTGSLYGREIKSLGFLLQTIDSPENGSVFNPNFLLNANLPQTSLSDANTTPFIYFSENPDGQGSANFGPEEISSHSLTISAVPLPASSLFLIAGLGALGLTARRKKAA